MVREIRPSESESIIYRESTHPIRFSEAASDAIHSRDLFYNLLNTHAQRKEAKAFQDLCRKDHVSVVIHDIKEKTQPPTFEVLEREDGARHIAVAVPVQFHLLVNEQNKAEHSDRILRLCGAVVRRYQNLVASGSSFMTSDEFAEYVKRLMEKK